VTVALSFLTVSVLVLIERYVLFRLELHNAKHQAVVNRVLVLGTDSVALRIKLALKQEPRLRSRTTRHPIPRSPRN
jgi:hypothetical protein